MAKPKVKQFTGYDLKLAEHVVIITLWENNLKTLHQALKVANESDWAKDKKILMMQTVEKENQPMRIVIVFEF